MKNKIPRIIELGTVTLISSLLLGQIASATGPSQTPPANNLPNATFNSVASGLVNITGAGAGNVDLMVNGRIVTGDAANLGGVWLDNSFKKFVGAINADWMGVWTGNWWRFDIGKNGQVVIDDNDHAGSGTGNGIALVGGNRALITRGWDNFTSGVYAGVGRWGLFMEPSFLTLGFSDLGSRGIKIARYHADSTKDDVLQIDENGISMPRANKLVNGTTYTDANCTSDNGKRVMNPNDMVDSLNDKNCYYPTAVSDNDGMVVKGHIAARTVGAFFPVTSVVSVATGSFEATAHCPNNNETPVNCGYEISTPFSANFFVTATYSYNNHGRVDCNYRFQNNTGAAKNVKIVPLCFNPSIYH